MSSSKCLLLLLLITLSCMGVLAKNHSSRPRLRRNDFPEDFIFGSATSAYQCEGAAHEDGRGPSIWDTFSEKFPEKIEDGTNGSIADDSYNLYMAIQKGEIGIALNTEWHYPYSDSHADKLAAARATAFSFDYFLEPIVYGRYPAEMVNYVKGGRLPTFTPEESSMLKGSYDFVGVNYYSSYYVKDVPCATENITMNTDSCVSIVGERNGVPIGPTAGSDWLLIYPEGIRDLLLHARLKFNDPALYITENGVDEASIGEIFLNDDLRIDYYAHHLKMVNDAILMGVNVKGYFAWSLMDNFEWSEGYTVRFGLVFVDFEDGRKRYLKKSAKWFRRLLKGEYNGARQKVLLMKMVEDQVYGIPTLKNSQIGTTLIQSHMHADRLATARATAFTFDYFMEPIVNGKYPTEMVKHVKDGRLPTFTPEESSMLKGSYDFIGINYYSSYVKDVPCATENITMSTDSCVMVIGERNGEPIGPKNIESLIQMKRRMGVTVKGYFAWSLMDNFEWAEGYTDRFGLVFVDFENGRKRYPKKSAGWFRRWLKGDCNGTNQQVAMTSITGRGKSLYKKGEVE
ncbi:hypothetical protein Bca101_021716 [Brassica carinata]